MTVPSYATINLDACSSSLAKEINLACNTDVEKCLECGKCTGGCSNAHIFDFTPRKMIKLIRLGYENTLLHMDALWACVSCHLCVDRCPMGINTPRIIDYLREKACRLGIKPSRPEVALFYRLMLSSIAKYGRLAEVPLMLQFNMRSRQYFKDSGLGARMFCKGKLTFFPTRIKDIQQVRRLCRGYWRKEGGAT